MEGGAGMGVNLSTDRPSLVGELEPVPREPTAVYLVPAGPTLVDWVVLVINEARGYDRARPVEDALIPRPPTVAKGAERAREKRCGNAEQLTRPGPRSGGARGALPA